MFLHLKLSLKRAGKISWLLLLPKDREIDVALRERIKSGRLFMCECNFSEDQVLHHDSRATLKPGEILTLNLCVKRFPPKSRESAVNISKKN